MATDKTRSVSGRVPTEVADALEADAAELGLKPGSLLRQILEGRYSSRRGVEKFVRREEKPDQELVNLK